MLAACARPVATRPEPKGVELSGVRLTTWRGARLTSHGTARRASLGADGFSAEGVELVSASGTRVRAPAAKGTLDLSRVIADAAGVKAPDGCEAATHQRVSWALGELKSEGPVSARGCGFSLDGSRLTYSVVERRALVDGPVRTRVEARP
jgi:hypothetical protein